MKNLRTAISNKHMAVQYPAAWLQEGALQGDLYRVEHKCICMFKQNVFVAF